MRFARAHIAAAGPAEPGKLEQIARAAACRESQLAALEARARHRPVLGALIDEAAPMAGTEIIAFDDLRCSAVQSRQERGERIAYALPVEPHAFERHHVT